MLIFGFAKEQSVSIDEHMARVILTAIDLEFASLLTRQIAAPLESEAAEEKLPDFEAHKRVVRAMKEAFPDVVNGFPFLAQLADGCSAHTCGCGHG